MVDLPEEDIDVLLLVLLIVTEQMVLRSKKLGCSMIILEQVAYLFLWTDLS